MTSLATRAQVCIICNKEFQTDNWRVKICSSDECHKIAKERRYSRYNDSQKGFLTRKISSINRQIRRELRKPIKKCRYCQTEFKSMGTNLTYCPKCSQLGRKLKDKMYYTSEKGKEVYKKSMAKYKQTEKYKLKIKIDGKKNWQKIKNNPKLKLKYDEHSRKRRNTKEYKEHSRKRRNTKEYKEHQQKYSKGYRKTEKYKLMKKESDKKYMQTKSGKLAKKISEIKRRHKKYELIQSFTYDEWIKKVKATNGICPHCKHNVGIDNMTIDHIIPISKAPIGFKYTINDVQPLCNKCNSTKGAKMINFPVIVYENYQLMEVEA